MSNDNNENALLISEMTETIQLLRKVVKQAIPWLHRARELEVSGTMASKIEEAITKAKAALKQTSKRP